MKLLEERILKDGKLAPGDVLRVDSFLNHQIDVPFIDQLAQEFYTLFQNEKIDKIVTVEASGITIATLVAQKFGVSLVFAKKSKTSNIPNNVYSAPVHSYTHNVDNEIVITKDYLKKGERVLLIDDFLANGQAMLGLLNICEQAGAPVVGAGIMVEKAFQAGRKLLEEKGVRVESLARVSKMDPETNTIEFVK